jgi:hypothetical protein
MDRVGRGIDFWGRRKRKGAAPAASLLGLDCWCEEEKRLKGGSLRPLYATPLVQQQHPPHRHWAAALQKVGRVKKAGSHAFREKGEGKAASQPATTLPQQSKARTSLRTPRLPAAVAARRPLLLHGGTQGRFCARSAVPSRSLYAAEETVTRCRQRASAAPLSLCCLYGRLFNR